MNVKKYQKCKKHHSWDPSTCICENSNYLKSIANTSMIECDETISAINIVSIKQQQQQQKQVL